jgi:thiol-disulfide isomerase/thioredoxin
MNKSLLFLFIIASIALDGQNCKELFDYGDLSPDKLYHYKIHGKYKSMHSDVFVDAFSEAYFVKDTTARGRSLGSIIYAKGPVHDFLYNNDASTVWDKANKTFYNYTGDKAVLAKGFSRTIYSPLVYKNWTPLDTSSNIFLSDQDSFLYFGFENVSVVDTGRRKVYFNSECFPYYYEQYTKAMGKVQERKIEILSFDSVDYQGQFFDSIMNLYDDYIPYSEYSNSEYSGGTRDSSIIDDIRQFTLLGLNGKSVKLENISNENMIIKFWYSYCAPCRLADSYLRDSIQIRDDVTIIYVNPVDSKDEVREYCQKNNLDQDRFYLTSHNDDRKLIRAYPTFVFYKDGQVQNFVEGWGKHVKHYLQEYEQP